MVAPSLHDALAGLGAISPVGETAPVLRVTFKDTSVFEIMTMHSRKDAGGTANGVEIRFSEPVDPTTINTAAISNSNVSKRR